MFASVNGRHSVAFLLVDGTPGSNLLQFFDEFSFTNTAYTLPTHSLLAVNNSDRFYTYLPKRREQNEEGLFGFPIFFPSPYVCWMCILPGTTLLYRTTADTYLPTSQVGCAAIRKCDRLVGDTDTYIHSPSLSF